VAVSKTQAVVAVAKSSTISVDDRKCMQRGRNMSAK
jgi:hypothetical protein